MAADLHHPLRVLAASPLITPQDAIDEAKRLNFAAILAPQGSGAEWTSAIADAGLDIYSSADQARPEFPVDPRRLSARPAADGGAWVDSPAEHAWPRDSVRRIARIRKTAVQAGGVIVPYGYHVIGDDHAVEAALLGVNHLLATDQCWRSGSLERLTSSSEVVEIWRRTNARDPRIADTAIFAIANRSDARQSVPAEGWTRSLGAFEPVACQTGSAQPQEPLEPHEVRFVSAVRKHARQHAPTLSIIDALGQSRLIVQNVSPSVDYGRYPVKASVGHVVAVEADIFMDGHDVISARVASQLEGEETWTEGAMALLANDRWRGQFEAASEGRYRFKIVAWLDVWGTFARDLARKHDAGLDVALEVREGCGLIADAQARRTSEKALALVDILTALQAADQEEAVRLLLAPATQEAMSAADERLFAVESFEQTVVIERREAGFASWYELFPRSQTDDPCRPGTLRDVIPRLRDIAAMGFDVLYFPPIHPIGRKNRKGPNNTLTAGEHDPGSPYAIGAATGGHDAIHPELGTLEDFVALVSAARAHGLEIALDFAIQCSPDHPWLQTHPGWFSWRADGSIKYAENPPKKYQDIVNVDFYAADAQPSLWEALRDVVLFWVGHGIKTFRVDNPHTKPLPFWEWMIGEVRARHPDVIFLSEAFTRPKMMYHLAKIGFSQSYTYFTWRNSKHELIEYLTELNTTAPRDFFRPHFFVNTPDINPYFLQTSGRAGFLIRAALAATLSGLWGMYSGFELCESEPLPGKEEYKDSEKFEIRPRNWAAPGNIIPEITKLNAIRRNEPALQSHLGITFYNAFNDQVLYFGKQAHGELGRILVAVSLDPRNAQSAQFEVPLWEYGLSDDQSVEVVDLINDVSFRWTGKLQTVLLTPEAPYAIWRIIPAAGGQ